MKLVSNLLASVFSFTVLIFTACGGNSSVNRAAIDSTTIATIDTFTTTDSAAATSTSQAGTENDLKAFLLNPDNKTYGWSSENDPNSYDFSKDGKLDIQGPDGEATMWQGTWELKGDKLTLNNQDLNETKTVTLVKDGKIFCLMA